MRPSCLGHTPMSSSIVQGRKTMHGLQSSVGQHISSAAMWQLHQEVLRLQHQCQLRFRSTALPPSGTRAAPDDSPAHTLPDTSSDAPRDNANSHRTARQGLKDQQQLTPARTPVERQQKQQLCENDTVRSVKSRSRSSASRHAGKSGSGGRGCSLSGGNNSRGGLQLGLQLLAQSQEPQPGGRGRWAQCC